MSAKERRRRPLPQGLFRTVLFCIRYYIWLWSLVKVKEAFGDENDDDNQQQNNRERLEENNLSFSNQYIDKTNDNVELDRSYERAFFTIHNTTVEVVLENDMLSWSTVTGESMILLIVWCVIFW